MVSYENRKRITASCFHRAAHTNTASPSISLIMSVCYPEKMKFKSASTCWGCEHEDIARTKYKSFSILAHHNFEVRKCGFFISSDFPFLGASPDGLVTCTCCGEGICEIKVCLCFFLRLDIDHVLFILVSILSQRRYYLYFHRRLQILLS